MNKILENTLLLWFCVEKGLKFLSLKREHRTFTENIVFVALKFDSPSVTRSVHWPPSFFTPLSATTVDRWHSRVDQWETGGWRIDRDVNGRALARRLGRRSILNVRPRALSGKYTDLNLFLGVKTYLGTNFLRIYVLKTIDSSRQRLINPALL